MFGKKNITRKRYFLIQRQVRIGRNNSQKASEKTKPYSIIFWNTHGLQKFHNISNDEYTNCIQNSVIISLTETWVTDTALKLPRFTSNYNICNK